MKKLYTVNIDGREKHWALEVMAEPEHVEAWREDGLRVDEVCNTIPEWVASLGAPSIRCWCFFQDIFYWKNPFAK